MNTLIWLQFKKFNKFNELKRDGEYVIARSDDRRNFEPFREQFLYKHNPVIATPLLLKYMKSNGFPIKTIKEFGHSYVTSMPTESHYFDKLCEWAREEIDKNPTNGKRIICM